MKEIFKDKKGFTLIELIVTIAIMAVIAGIAVPSVTVTVSRRQKQTAEADTQQMYRTAVSTISDLSRSYIKPEYPYRVDADFGEEDETVGGWYTGYADVLVRKLYATVLGLDIKIMYWDGASLVQPSGTTYLSRTTTILAGNKDPYIVIQIKKVQPSADSAATANYMYISYHNAKNPFTVDNDGNVTSVYKNNSGADIIYKYRIR